MGRLVRAEDLPLLDDLTGHPLAEVRHNLDQARLGVVDPDRRRPVLLPYLPNLGDYATRPST